MTNTYPIAKPTAQTKIKIPGTSHCRKAKSFKPYRHHFAGKKKFCREILSQTNKNRAINSDTTSTKRAKPIVGDREHRPTNAKPPESRNRTSVPGLARNQTKLRKKKRKTQETHLEGTKDEAEPNLTVRVTRRGIGSRK